MLIKDVIIRILIKLKNQKEESCYDEIYEKVLKNVPQQNKKYVEKQLNELEKNFMDYLSYWNEKYYRNGFVDGVQIAIGCYKKWNNIRRIYILLVLFIF